MYIYGDGRLARQKMMETDSREEMGEILGVTTNPIPCPQYSPSHAVPPIVLCPTINAL